MTTQQPDLASDDAPRRGIAAGEAAELRRALVRFLVEASVEDTPQAKVATDLVAAVRAVPAQSAAQLARLERRLEHRLDQLSIQVERLAAAVAVAPSAPRTVSSPGSRGPGSQGRPAARRPLSAAVLGVLGGIAAALLTAAVLVFAVPGMAARLQARALAAVATGTRPAPAAPATQADNQAPAAVPASGGPPQGVPAVSAAWGPLWARVLAAPVTACAAGSGVPLRRCVCEAGEAEGCTLAQAQAIPGGAVLVLQGLLQQRKPARVPPRARRPDQSGQPDQESQIDGRLALPDAWALAKLTRRCSALGKPLQQQARQLLQERMRGEVPDADRMLEPILTGLSRAPQCVEAAP